VEKNAGTAFLDVPPRLSCRQAEGEAVPPPLISSHIGSAMGKRPEIPTTDGAADGKSAGALRQILRPEVCRHSFSSGNEKLTWVERRRRREKRCGGPDEATVEDRGEGGKARGREEARTRG